MKKSLKNKISVFVVLVLIFSFSVILFGCKNNQIKSQSKNLTNYSLNLTYDDSTKTLNGKQTVDYQNNLDTTLNKLEFHLYPNAFRKDAKFRPVSTANYNKAYPNGFSEGWIDISLVSVNGVNKEVLVAGSDNNMLVVNLDEELFPLDRVQVELEYNIKVPNCLHRFGYGDNTYNFGNFYPIVSVYENGKFREDNYGANGDPFYSEMSNYNVQLTYDNDFVLASSGEQIDTTESEGKKTTKMTANVVRDFAFVLSKDFSVISKKAGKTTVFYYYFDDATSTKSLQAGVDSINTFNDLFGEYPYSTFSVVKADFIHGGMEYPNLVYIASDIEKYEDYLNVIVHETAHQWWYNLVGSNACDNAWQDEGLTEFSTLMFYRYNEGYNVNIQDSLNASLSSYLLFTDICQSVYGKVDSRMARNVNDFSGDMEYVYMTYVKGVLFFDSLEDLIGEKAFLKGLKQYFNQNEYKIASVDDMISSFELVSKRNLESFFDSWLQGKVILQNYK